MTYSTDPFADFDAILVLSYGGPEGPDDVLPFMRNATKGRGVPDSRLAIVSVHYNKFDGVSPIVARTRELVATLTNAIRAQGSTIPVYLANRNWHPFVKDVLRNLHNEGLHKILYLPTSAFDSYSGCRQYREDLAQAAAELEAEEGITGFEFKRTPPFYRQPGFINANALAVLEAIRETTAALHVTFEDETAAIEAAKNGGPAFEMEEPTVLFVTHSIPIPMAEQSGLGPDGEIEPKTDPSQIYEYDREHLYVINEICKQVEAARGRKLPWKMTYCSRSGSPRDPWQEPDINDVIAELGEQGVKRVVVSPIGFIYDHMEVVYDLDIEVTEATSEFNMIFKRARTPGLHPEFIDALRNALSEAAVAEDTRAAYRSNLNSADYVPLPAVCEQDS